MRLSAIAACVALAMSLCPYAKADSRQDCVDPRAEIRVQGCSEVLKSGPAFWALANRAIGYRVLRQFENALADANAAMRINASTAGLYLERGFIHLGKANHDLAAADFSEAVRLDPRLTSAYFGRALAYENVGDARRAKKDLEQAVAIDRALVGAHWLQHGDELRAAGRHKDSITAYDRALIGNPDMVLANYRRGLAHEA